jgi:hypothetical protein
MASWKKYMRPHGSTAAPTQMPTGDYDKALGTSAKYASYLPQVYAGHPNRIQRYSQYEEMNRDSFIRAALDTLAEFCTQSEEANESPFDVQYLSEANETEVKLLKESLQIWTSLNDFNARLFSMVRNTVMNGDSFYLRDPETMEWKFLDHFSVTMAKVDEDDDSKIKEYLIRGFDEAKQAKYSTTRADLSSYGSGNQSQVPFAMNSYVSGNGGSFNMAGSEKNLRQNLQKIEQECVTIDAANIIHLSMSDSLDINWPFGTSVLDSAFKVWKQKELLEDAIIIYRVSRAPERRVFYIDVGQMNQVQARGYVEAIKNEIHQRRIPNAGGGGQSMLDAAHNPLSMLDDYFLPQTAEGRGSKVEVLPGGDSVGEITDLSYFKRELAQAFKIPATYLPFGEDPNGAAYNDGKLGTATIQEFMFNKYCMRLQNLISTPFDSDFKRFLKDRGIEIEPTLYKLKFTPPQSFTKYREIELQTQQVNLFTQIIQVPFIAKSFAMKKWLDLSEDEMIENEIAWARENPDKIKAAHGQTAGDAEEEGDLADVGIRGSMGGMDMGMDPAMDDLGAETDPAAGTDPAAAGGDPAAAAAAPAGGAMGGAAPAGPTGAI